MWLALATGALAAGPPEVRIDWKKDRATVRIEAPPDQKVAPTAPARLVLGWADRDLELSTDGELLGRGVQLADLRGQQIEGTLEVGLCDRSGESCRPTRWSLLGAVPQGRRGSVGLEVGEPGGEEAVPFGPDATADAATEAFERARAHGTAVLLDFSAVWCPPCNLLAAEILHGAPAPELEGYEVAVLDVDHPSSFALKDRYAVGGYPTVVVVDADGAERSRMVGYTGREAFLGWLAGAAGSTDASDLLRPVDELSPSRAAELAWLQVQAGDEEAARPLLARAEADRVETRMARLSLQPEVADLEWLLAHAPERAPSYVGGALELKDTAPELARRCAELALREASAAELADVLAVAASLEDPSGARALNAAAAAVTRSAMTGDRLHDKGYVTSLAHFLEEGGDPEGAVALLERAAADWPGEPTFDLALAPLLRRLSRLEEALVSAERAAALAWGDNRLRAVANQAEILVAMGRAPEARALAQAELEAQPATDLRVRTPRYRSKLEALVRPETD